MPELYDSLISLGKSFAISRTQRAEQDLSSSAKNRDETFTVGMEDYPVFFKIRIPDSVRTLMGKIRIFRT